MRLTNMLVLSLSMLAVTSGSVLAKADAKKTGINIIYSNDMEGSVDTCGCATDPGGGAVRRVNWYKKNNFMPFETIYLNGGNTLFTTTEYLDYEVKYLKYGARVMADSMKAMSVDAYTPGEQDFKMGMDFFLATTKGLPVVITNSGSDKFKKQVLVNKGGMKIAVMGVISEKLLSKEMAAALSIKDPAEAVRDTVKKLKKEADLVILITVSDEEGLRQILKRSDGVDLVLSAGISEQVTHPMLDDDRVLLRIFPSGDSVGVLRYREKKDTGFENRIDFLGSMYAGKNAFTVRAKKYEALRKTSTPRL